VLVPEQRLRVRQAQRVVIRPSLEQASPRLPPPVAAEAVTIQKALPTAPAPEMATEEMAALAAVAVGRGT